MDDYLTKPISLDKLEISLEQWLPAPDSDDRCDTQHPPAANLETTDSLPELSILDTSILAALIGEDANLITEFLDDFRRSLGEGAVVIEQALKTSDLESVSEAAHKLKSSSRSVGALAMGAYCENLEHLDEISPDNIEIILEAFNQQVNALLNSLAEQNTITA